MRSSRDKQSSMCQTDEQSAGSTGTALTDMHKSWHVADDAVSSGSAVLGMLVPSTAVNNRKIILNI